MPRRPSYWITCPQYPLCIAKAASSGCLFQIRSRRRPRRIAQHPWILYCKVSRSKVRRVSDRWRLSKIRSKTALWRRERFCRSWSRPGMRSCGRILCRARIEEDGGTWIFRWRSQKISQLAYLHGQRFQSQRELSKSWLRHWHHHQQPKSSFLESVL